MLTGYCLNFFLHWYTIGNHREYNKRDHGKCNECIIHVPNNYRQAWALIRLRMGPEGAVKINESILILPNESGLNGGLPAWVGLWNELWDLLVTRKLGKISLEDFDEQPNHRSVHLMSLTIWIHTFAIPFPAQWWLGRIQWPSCASLRVSGWQSSRTSL